MTAAAVIKNLADPPAKSPVAHAPRPNVDAADPLLAVSSDRYYEALTGWESSPTHVRCPFWAHRSNPAMMLYDGGTWYCFACGEGGSVYEFAAKLWGLGTRGADFVELKARLADALG